MYASAILGLYNSHSEYIAIPVKNFPALPVGSEVELDLGEEIWFENGRIEEYTVDNKNGLMIKLAFPNLDNDDTFLDDERWNAIAKHCVEDGKTLVDFVYPHIIDYGAQFFSPEQSTST